MFRMLFTQIANRIDERFRDLNERLISNVTTLKEHLQIMRLELQQIHRINTDIASIQGKLMLIEERTRRFRENA